MEIWATLLGFTLVLVVTNRTNNLTAALVSGSITMGILAGLSMNHMFTLVKQAVLSPTTIDMTITIILIGILGRVMQQSGKLDKMVNSLGQLVSDIRYSLILLPSLIGLLPVLGGAALSAPLIDGAGDKVGLNNNEKAAINQFYRHIWYFIYPLYPSLILAGSMAHISVFKFIALQAIPTLLVLILSFKWFFPARAGVNYICKNEKNNKAKAEFFSSIAPLLLVLILAIGFQMSFAVALLAGIGLALIGNYYNAVKFIWAGINWPLALVVIVIMIFKEFVQNIGGVAILANHLTAWGIPLFALAIVIAFITGFSTGANMAAIAASYAIFIPIIPEDLKIYYLTLIFSYSMVGYIVSPLHLCGVLTYEYYCAEALKVFKKIAPLLALYLILVTGLIGFLIV